MKIQFLSDLHLEFDNSVENFNLPKTDADVAVLACDIGLTSEKYFEWVKSKTAGKDAIFIYRTNEWVNNLLIFYVSN